MHLFPRTRKGSPPTQAAPPDAVTPLQYDLLMSAITEMSRRIVRTETRVMRLLDHHGLDAQGNPRRTNGQAVRKETR